MTADRRRRDRARVRLKESKPSQEVTSQVATLEAEQATPPVREPEQEMSPIGRQTEPPSPLRQAMWNPVLTVEEVAMLLRVEPEIVLKLTGRGELLSFKVHKEVRVMRIDLYRFLIEQRQKPTTLKLYKESEKEEHAYSTESE